MSPFARYLLVTVSVCSFGIAEATAQQLGPPQAVPQQPAQQQAPAAQPLAPVPAQPPAGFQLNQLQQAALDAVLDSWQRESGQISTFRCPFERWEYDVAFGPGQNIPLNKNKGELSYRKPDQGSFQITEIATFQAQAVPPGQQPPPEKKGDWAKQPNAIGEHWVCDGKSIFEYRHDQKQLVERPIPKELQGQAIVDGPLPFLFGADSAKLKQRYWMKLEEVQTQNPAEIWVAARPRFQEQAADFSEVRVILDRNTRMLPKYMQVQMPSGSRHMYIFKLDQASVNGAFQRLQALFDRPRVPSGWKHVIENMPLAQAPQPDAQPPR